MPPAIMFRGLFTWLMLIVWFTPRIAAGTAHTRVGLISERQTVAMGESFEVGVLLKMETGWHTYWKDPGESGLATSVQWKLPQGFTAGPLRWPKPIVLAVAGITSYGYEDEVLLLTRIQTPSQGYSNGQSVKLEARVDWLECAVSCVPGSAKVMVALQIGKAPALSSPAVVALFEKYRALIPPDDYHPSKDKVKNARADPIPNPFPPADSRVKSQIPPPTLWAAALGAFLGGIILNLMPCVLPVIAIKILGFIQQGKEEPRRVRKLGLIFGLGVLVSFWILAMLIVILRTAGAQVGWGFQFQNPAFVMFMALVVTVIALNFFGVFEFELAPAALGAADHLASRQGIAGAFFNGVLATALATPCTAPFLAPALGFAFSQPPAAILAIFTAAGAGLALPYVVLAWEPRLLKWLPKPGAWMLRFKQAMGFPMIATALWLTLWVLRSYGSNLVFAATLWLLVVAMGIWLASILKPGRLWPVWSVTAILALAGYLHVSRLMAGSELIAWKPYSKAALRDALQTAHPVFVDFTADWCLTCQANKKIALEIPSVARRFKELDVVPLLADWTRRDDEITGALRSFNRSGVPLYVLYPSDRRKPPIVLPEVLTPRIVLDALSKASIPD
ncbi:MAG: thioredoxin family protein [Verrucomicrobia bacterium]|nr:thioredoxin family protein [Verrucomicrobiota bacterium]